MAATALYFPVYFAFAGNLAPHAPTVRISYTVPSGKRAEIRNVQLNVQDIPAAGAAVVYSFIRVTAIDVGYVLSDAVAQQKYYNFQGILDITSGDLVEILTNNSAAANYIFRLSLAIREY